MEIQGGYRGDTGFGQGWLWLERSLGQQNPASELFYQSLSLSLSRSLDLSLSRSLSLSLSRSLSLRLGLRLSLPYSTPPLIAGSWVSDIAQRLIVSMGGTLT